MFLGKKRFEVKRHGGATLFAFNQGRAECFELCIFRFEKSESSSENLTGRRVPALLNLLIDKMGKVLA